MSAGFNDIRLKQNLIIPKGSFILYQNLNDGKVSLNSQLIQSADYIINFSTNSQNISFIQLKLNNSVSFCLRPLIKKYYYFQSVSTTKFYPLDGNYTINITMFNLTISSSFQFLQSFLWILQVKKSIKS